jgi:hypothetical protein
VPFYVSPAIERLTGHRGEEFNACPQLWLKLIVADDRQLVIEGLATLMREGTLDLEYRIVHADGGVRRVRSMAQVVHGTGGMPSRIDGVITELADAQPQEGHGAAPSQRHGAASVRERDRAAPDEPSPLQIRRSDDSQSYQCIIGLRALSSPSCQTVPTDATLPCD